jgi:phosphohistidine phosphatase
VPTLVLLRHAKSAYPAGVDDHDRPLNARGERESVLVGEALAERLPELDLALVSTAERALLTWEAVSGSVAVRSHEVRDDLYLAPVDHLLELVQALPVETSSAVVVAHNDGLEQLASRLSGVPVTLKTSTFAILRSDRPWSDWKGGSVSLDEVVVAR